MVKKDETMVVEKFVGSKGWLWFWIIMCFPIAIAYYFMNKEPVRTKIR
jgi:hypothetical protein